MKKLISVLACLAIVLVGGISLAACGQTYNVTVPDKTTIGQVEFANDASFKLNYKGDNHFVAEGKAANMTEEQAKAWGTVKDSKFVVVSVNGGKDSELVFGWKAADKSDEAFKENEINGDLIKKETLTDDAEDFVLALSDGQTERHPELKVWRVEVKEKDAEESTAYTIDFSALYSAEDAPAK